MTTIENLSNEVIYIILQQKVVSIKDVVSFGLTCSRFLNVINHNDMLWKMKLYQRWPQMKRIYDNRIQNKERINFKDEVKASIKCRNELRSYLSLMSERFFQKDNFFESDMEHFDALFCPNMGAHIMNYYFLKDEMLHLIKIHSILPDSNLTHKYYSKELIIYLQQRHTKDAWQEFISYPKEQQLLEKAATIVAQWFQPLKYVFYFDVEASLDNIAQQVLERLKKAHWEHPIFSTSAKQFSFWKNNINDNHWSKKEAKQIIDMIRIVLFDELHFCGAPRLKELYEFRLWNLLIDGVLKDKVGDAVCLAIIFQSVARRLGVRCDLTTFPTHFFLSWKPKSSIEKSEEEYFYIDILHGGAIMDRNDCPRIRGRRCPIESFNEHNEISPTEMVLRMGYHIQVVEPNYQYDNNRTLQMRSLLEFRYMVKPYNIDEIRELGRHYMQNQMNLSDLLTSLQTILDRCKKMQDSCDIMQNRIACMDASRAEELLYKFQFYMQKKMTLPSLENISPLKTKCKIKYAIGTIVTLKKYCAGVIIGWDETYNSRHITNPELKIIDVSEFNSVTQPFYFILGEDGNKYYVAEDFLINTPKIARPRWITHNEIGRYFCSFAGSHYVPNEALKKQYPSVNQVENQHESNVGISHIPC